MAGFGDFFAIRLIVSSGCIYYNASGAGWAKRENGAVMHPGRTILTLSSNP